MKNSILSIVGIIAAVTVLIPIFYNPLTDHYRYTAPIKNSDLVANYTHVDSFPFEGMDDTFEDNMFDISLVDSETVEISFRSHGKLLSWQTVDFEDFERDFGIGENFVTRCQEDKDKSVSYLTIFEFNGTRQINGQMFVDFIHAEAVSKVPIPCDYPQIVDYSTNVFELD